MGSTGRDVYELWWKPALKFALKVVGVQTRHDFVQWSGWPKSTVYDAFPHEDFSGVATYSAVAELACRLGLDLSQLVSARKVSRTTVTAAARR